MYKLFFKIKIIGILFITGFFFIGCEKLNINGDLDGEWEVMNVYPSPPPIELDTRYFYNFQLHVCQLTIYGLPFTNGNLDYKGSNMTLNFPYIKNQEEILQLKQYGIFTNPVTFNVEFIGKTGLILSNEDVTITLRKF